MKVIFMGTPEFSVGTLKALIEAGHEVVLAVTQPDKPKGRGGRMQYPPVKEMALEYGIPVFQPKKIRAPECVEELRKYEADIMVVIAFGQILPKEILEMTPYGCVNVHASLLPKYRGAAPIQWAVINGEKVSGVTTMQMDEGLDTGDMISQAAVPLDEKETGGSLFDKLADLGAELLVKTLPSIFDRTAVREKQPEESPTPYAAMITKQMGLMDFHKSAQELERLVRGMNPWPSAYTFLNGKTFKIWEASVVSVLNGDGKPSAEPGTVIAADTGRAGIHVACGKDILVLTEVQLEGKKRMDAASFLRGYQVEPGTVLRDHKE